MKQEENIKPIGGYFELELPRHPIYHAKAIALNTGRNGLEYILRIRKYKKLYVPYFTCSSVVEPLEKTKTPYAFYAIDKHYKIKDPLELAEGEALLYTNYWGLQDDYCKQLALQYKHQLIVDNTQAFYSLPMAGIDTFYSCRKYFGVPDGGYLYTDAEPRLALPQDESHQRMDALVKRIDCSAESGYADFHTISAGFHNMPIRKMSKFTQRMMQSIDYEAVAQRRINNYNYLRERLNGTPLRQGQVPMIYPYETLGGQQLRKKLIDSKVFVAKYWPNVEEWAGAESTETWMANHILPLPIDQRYNEMDMERIITLIKS